MPDQATVNEVVRLAIDRLPVHAFITLGPDYRITSWNQGAERLLGYKGVEIIGLPLTSVFSPNQHDGAIGADDLQEALRRTWVSRARWLTRSDGGVVLTHTTLLALSIGSDVVGYAVVAQELTPAGASRAEAAGARVEDHVSQLSESRRQLAVEIADRAEAEEGRIRLLRRLIMSQEAERRRIAGDLHDALGQRLTALRLMLEAVQRTGRDDARIAATVAEALEVLAGIDHDVNFIAWELRPAALDDLGLLKVLQSHIREWARHTGIRAEFHYLPPDLERLSPEVETVLFRIAREGLNNVAKHAGARSADVTLEQHPHEILLTVRDDGVGFQPQGETATMMGLEGMREHALAMGGRLDIEAAEGGGTRLMATIPMATPGRSRAAAGAVAEIPLPAAPRAVVVPPSSEPLSTDDTSARDARVRELQRAVSARDEFIATVAHELRNPIAPIMFQVRLALGKIDQTTAAGAPIQGEWVQSQLRGVEQKLHRLLETLDRLLDVSRLSSGRIDLRLEPMDLATVVGDVLGTMESEFAVARCKVIFSTHGDTTGTWDRLRVEQVCRNLLSNAARFGAGRPIEVTVTGDGDRAMLQVQDHGIGIPRDRQAHIFERFEQGLERRSGGFGVGLWIVRNICLAMGGAVTLRSDHGEGACFSVTLPRRPGRTPNLAELE